ncbi:hypothetical protein C8J56DRAFT_1156906 [Mycena floridula]|nr:hypothetical protein C8J56DRAFT_1156906 [Mycena floridula]
MVTDPKAVPHFHTRETYVYVQNSLSRVAIADLFGKGILWAEGDIHRSHVSHRVTLLGHGRSRDLRLHPSLADTLHDAAETMSFLGAPCSSLQAKQQLFIKDDRRVLNLMLLNIILDEMLGAIICEEPE